MFRISTQFTQFIPNAAIFHTGPCGGGVTSDNDGKYDNYCSYCPAQAAPRPLPTANNHSFIFMRTLTHCLTVCTYYMPSCDSHSEHGLLDICLLSAR